MIVTKAIPAFLLFAAATTSGFPQRLEELPQGVELKANLVYAQGGGRDLHLDLFLPNRGEGSHPAIVYIHGGGWRTGDRRHFWRQAARMASEGFVGACIEYRLSGEAKFPAAVEDAKAAVRWLRSRAPRYHIDPNRIGAAGGSAGGHLAAMLGTTSHLRQLEGRGGNTDFSSRVQAVAAFNPALDLVAFGKRASSRGRQVHNPIYRFLGVTYPEDPELWTLASPMSHVSRDSAPFLFLHGTHDGVVPYRQSEAMLEKLRNAGVEAEIFTAEGAPHTFYSHPHWFEPTLKRMGEFFKRVLR